MLSTFRIHEPWRPSSSAGACSCESERVTPKRSTRCFEWRQRATWPVSVICGPSRLYQCRQVSVSCLTRVLPVSVQTCSACSILTTSSSFALISPRVVRLPASGVAAVAVPTRSGFSRDTIAARFLFAFASELEVPHFFSVSAGTGRGFPNWLYSFCSVHGFAENYPTFRDGTSAGHDGDLFGHEFLQSNTMST